MRVVSLAIVSVMLFATNPASAGETCEIQTKDRWQSVERVKKAAIDLGFSKIVKVILEDNCYEVVTLDADGRTVGVQFDPVTLKLVKVEEAHW